MNIDPAHPYVVPTPGFDPSTASSAQLDAENFPSRPSTSAVAPDGTSALATWAKFAKNYLAGKVVKCADPLPSQQPAWVKNIINGANGYWSGYSVNGSSWNKAETGTYIPSINVGVLSQWVGVNLGTVSGEPIDQGGWLSVYGFGSCLFYEQANQVNSGDGDGNANCVINAPAANDQAFYKVVDYTSPSHSQFFDLKDVTTSTEWSHTFTSSVGLDGHAEMFTERPCNHTNSSGVCNGWATLGGFTTTADFNAEVAATQSADGFVNLVGQSPVKATMTSDGTSGGTTLADATGFEGVSDFDVNNCANVPSPCNAFY